VYQRDNLVTPSLAIHANASEAIRAAIAAINLASVVHGLILIEKAPWTVKHRSRREIIEIRPFRNGWQVYEAAVDSLGPTNLDCGRTPRRRALRCARRQKV